MDAICATGANQMDVNGVIINATGARKCEYLCHNNTLISARCVCDESSEDDGDGNT